MTTGDVENLYTVVCEEYEETMKVTQPCGNTEGDGRTSNNRQISTVEEQNPHLSMPHFLP